MTQISEDTPEHWKEELNSLQCALESSNENGLLKDDPSTYGKIMKNVASALNDLSLNPPKVIDAREKFSLACQEFNKHTNSAGFAWRFIYCYGGMAFIYLLGILAAILLLWFSYQPYLLSSNILWVPSWAFLWGATGGILYGLWWLWQHTSRREFRKVWYVWYIILPISGSILGAIAYLVFMAGFIASTGTASVESPFFIMLFSALAGFSNRWTVKLLEKVTKLIEPS